MKKLIYLHPLTIPVFIFFCFTPYKSQYFVLYFFIFCHELSHLLCATLLGEKCNKIHLYPWGCMLCLTTVPSRGKSIAIFLSGPLFNFIMFAFGVYPNENLSLALFNLFPLIPLDGGIIVNIISESLSFPVSVLSVILLSLFCLYKNKSLVIPFIFTIVLIISEKQRIEKNINSRIISHFFVENNAKKLYNKIDKL